MCVCVCVCIHIYIYTYIYIYIYTWSVSKVSVLSVVRYCCLCMVAFYNLVMFAMQENIEKRNAIKFCVKLNKSATKTFASLTETYGDATLSRTVGF